MPHYSEKPINFLIDNHAPCVSTEDMFEYIAQGFRSIGVRVNYSTQEYRGDAVNLMMEGCNAESGASIAALRQQFPRSRLYLIATEILTSDGFNSANAVHRNGAEHYSNAPYWTDRTNGFRAIAPGVDGLVFFAESLIDGYRGLHHRHHYVPLVALPGYPVLDREPGPERDIDIFFSGTLTAYRQEVLGLLAQRGLKVVAQSVSFAEYVRRHYLRRAKLAIGLRLGPDTRFMSKQRAHYCLMNRIPHVFEATSDQTDLHPYMLFSAPGQAFLDRCSELLSRPESFPGHVFDDFRNNPSFAHTAVFDDFRRFLHA